MLLRFILLLKTVFLIATTNTSPSYKVGLLLNSEDEKESNAIKRLADYTISTLPKSNISLQLEVEHYDSTYLSVSRAICSLIDKNVVTIMSAGGSSSTAVQSDLIRQFRIPYVAAVASNPFTKTSDSNNLEIRLSPSDINQSEAIFALMKEFKWYVFSILASADSYGIRSTVRLQYLTSADINFDFKNILHFEVNKDLSRPAGEMLFTKELEELKESLVKVIVLSCPGKYAKRIFSEAKGLGLMEKDYVWITTDGITSRPDTIAYNDGSYLSYYTGLFGTTPYYGKDTPDYNALVDAYVVNGGSSSDFTMSSIKVSEGLRAVYSSVVGLESIDMDDLREVECGKTKGWADGQTLHSGILKNYSERVMGFIEGATYFPSYEVMNFKPNGFEKVGYWTSQKGLVDAAGKKVPWRSRDDLNFLGGTLKTPTGLGSSLRGRELRIGITNWPPISEPADRPDCKAAGDLTQVHCWVGWSPDIFARLAKDLNFTYTYVPYEVFGVLDENTTTWNGIMADLIARKIDLSVSMAITTERSKDIGFTAPFYQDCAALAMYPAQGDEKPASNLFFFLEPFELSVWGCIILLVVAIALITNCLSKFSPFGSYGEKVYAMQSCTCKKCVMRKELKSARKCRFVDTKHFDCLVDKVLEEDDMNDLSYYNSTWLIGTGFVLQGTDVLPTSPSGRLLLFTWWLFMMILTSMYTAHLTTNLTVVSPGKTITSFEELVNGQHIFKWGLPVQQYIPVQMKKSKYEFYRNIYDTGEKFNDFLKAMNRTRLGNFVHIDSKSDLEYAYKDDCTAVISYSSSFQYQWGLGLPLNSPYIEVINRLFIAYREEGLFTFIYDKWHKGGTDSSCGASSASEGEEEKYTFTPTILAGLFLILFCGMLWAFITSCLEFLYASYLDSKENNEAISQCFRKRIRLKKREIIEEWFGKYREDEQAKHDRAARDELILRKYQNSRAARPRSPAESGSYVLKQHSS